MNLDFVVILKHENAHKNIIHETNEFEQAEYFLFALLNRVKESTGNWTLSMKSKSIIKHPNSEDEIRTVIQYEFIKSLT